MTDSDDRATKQDITEVLVRYATGIDRRDWDLFRRCFTADVIADYGDIGTWCDVESLTQFMVESHTQMGHTMHKLSNMAISVEGDRATARTYVDGVLMAADGQSGLNPSGFYDDELIQTPDGWRIARRLFTMVHVRPLGR
jgi:3-phenylpropionate/cinnamic acid dioxygenase small subunit